uniref:Uncharacterized protein n=1 Tax=Anopheles minimus TaxID=112268 RepID=A0A182WPQ2_9DIPT
MLKSTISMSDSSSSCSPASVIPATEKSVATGSHSSEKIISAGEQQPSTGAIGKVVPLPVSTDDGHANPNSIELFRMKLEELSVEMPEKLKKLVANIPSSSFAV